MNVEVELTRLELRHLRGRDHERLLRLLPESLSGLLKTQKDNRVDPEAAGP